MNENFRQVLPSGFFLGLTYRYYLTIFHNKKFKVSFFLYIRQITLNINYDSIITKKFNLFFIT